MANAMEKKSVRDWSDRLNPVFIKEMRQYFHNRGILAVMGVLLLVQLLMLVVMQLQVAGSRNEYFGSGAVMFGMVATGMALAAFLVSAVGSVLRFTAERRDRELDFSRITTLSPNRIIWGKLLGALVMTIFIYALCLPFIVIAYFLRGIAMSEMLLVALAILPPVLIASQAGILIGCAGRRWLIGVYFGGMFLLGLFFLGFFGFLAASHAVSGTSSFGGMVLFWCTFCLFPFGLFYALSVAALSSRYANRMLPVRLFLVAALLLTPLFGLAVAWLSDGRIDPLPAALCAFGVGGAMIAGICATLAAFERLDPGRRVRRSWPRNRVGKFVWFLFSSGAWGGIALSWLVVLATGVVAALLFTIVPDGGRTGIAVLCWGAVACYFLFYAQLAVWASAHWKILPGWCFWIFGVILFVFVPLLFCGLLAMVTEMEVEILLVTTPFCLALVKPGSELVMAVFGPFFALASLALAASSYRKGENKP